MLFQQCMSQRLNLDRCWKAWQLWIITDDFQIWRNTPLWALIADFPPPVFLLLIIFCGSVRHAWWFLPSCLPDCCMGIIFKQQKSQKATEGDNCLWTEMTLWLFLSYGMAFEKNQVNEEMSAKSSDSYIMMRVTGSHVVMWVAKWPERK